MILFLRLALLLAFAVSGATAAQQEITFCHYNVENYVDEQPPREGQRSGTKAKPEKEIAAVIHLIGEIRPDILGVCEMGSPERFADFQSRLKQAGLDYGEAEYVAGPDEARHLALLSRFPIVERNSRADVSFELNGQAEKVRRGILDVTVQVTPRYRLRVVGVHLKSKLPAPEGEALVRRAEAQQVRAHLDEILATSPQVNLLCYGDFNDAKNTTTFQEITGPRSSPTRLIDLPARDSHGDRWTHYWKVADLYSRIDYLFASTGLLPEVVKDSATVHRSPRWSEGSDHRPIYVRISPPDR